ncbi:SH3 domain-containing protein [Methylocystis heyeri]|uniref:SH3 domain-containing protein n=1 Tax=Methylocystis heyeri TaxID=391905 RepID=A0A6B8KB77_9HYPH|nr:SH3 domain-containing protein [Methylocystis heyeri]QGM44782.1 SH3 domain-containing protein [Methylocystis heyeri]
MAIDRCGKTLAACMAIAAGVAFNGSALAEILTREICLRARPAANAAVVGTLGEGAEVAVQSSRRGWSLVGVGGARGYVPTSALARLAPYSANEPNPNCDLGYPYSGSSVYFTGLTALRTEGPLAALFGRHISRPC